MQVVILPIQIHLTLDMRIWCSGVCLTLSAAKEVASSVCGVFSADICRAARDVDSEVCFAAIRVIKLAAKLELTSAKKHIGELMQPLIFTIQDAANIKVICRCYYR